MELNTLLIGGTALVAVGVAFSIVKKHRKDIDVTKIKGENAPSTFEHERKSDREGQKPFDKRPANVAFLENINLFAPLLKGLEKGIIDKEKWKLAIISTNNEQLIHYWESVINSKDLATRWLKVFLEPCGIKCEDCESFISTPTYAEKYVLKDGSPVINGEYYKVLASCWILSTYDENEVENTTILHKGLVDHISK